MKNVHLKERKKKGLSLKEVVLDASASLLRQGVAVLTFQVTILVQMETLMQMV